MVPVAGRYGCVANQKFHCKSVYKLFEFFVLKLIENEKKFTKRILKKIDYIDLSLEANACILIPENWYFLI